MTRCCIRNTPNFPKVAQKVYHNIFNLAIFPKKPPKSPNTWATFAGKSATKNFQKSPNLGPVLLRYFKRKIMLHNSALN